MDEPIRVRLAGQPGPLLAFWVYTLHLISLPLVLCVIEGPAQVRIVTGVWFVLAGSAFWAAHRKKLELPGVEPGWRLFFLGLALGALITGDAIWLRTVPVVSSISFAMMALRSLKDQPFYEKIARFFAPGAPDFIEPYCRFGTKGWAFLFGTLGLTWATFEVLRPELWPQAVRGGLLVVGAVTFVEFLYRKIYFRHYVGGPLDPLFSRLFPAHKTEMGRKSEAFLQELEQKRGASELESVS